MWSGPCLGGPMDTMDGVSRFPSGFLYVDRMVCRAWIYDFIPLGESPTGGAFQVRMEQGSELIEDPDQYKNRWRAAEESEFDIRVPVIAPDTPPEAPQIDAAGLNGVYWGIARWEALYPSSAFCGDPFESELDMSMSEADLIAVTRRFMVVWSDRRDKRRFFLEGFSGWTGEGDAKRWDLSRSKVYPTGNHHHWHFMVEASLETYGDHEAFEAMVSIASGESSTTWDKHHSPR
jgi:hypothetical protein